MWPARCATVCHCAAHCTGKVVVVLFTCNRTFSKYMVRVMLSQPPSVIRTDLINPTAVRSVSDDNASLCTAYTELA